MVKNIPYLCLLLPLIVLVLLPMNSYAGEQGLSVGYGFAALSNDSGLGKIEDGKNYDFFQLAYFYETPFWKRTSLLIEPFAAYVNRPRPGGDVGLDLLLRYYPFQWGETRLFFDVGAGLTYTSIRFQEQGTHLLGVLTGGIGIRYKNFFIEDRFKHLSNGNTEHPNRSVNANIISVGMYF
jgi:hypothetical protein